MAAAVRTLQCRVTPLLETTKVVAIVVSLSKPLELH